MRKTKIVCTLGPATNSAQTIENMLKAGMNVARLNFSHGDHETHQKMLDLFRSVRDRLEIPAAIMLDTKGPEIRLCDFEGGKAELEEGSEFVLTSDRSVKGSAASAAVTYDGLPSQLSPGNHILIDDGRISLEVTE